MTSPTKGLDNNTIDKIVCLIAQTKWRELIGDYSAVLSRDEEDERLIHTITQTIFLLKKPIIVNSDKVFNWKEKSHD